MENHSPYTIYFVQLLQHHIPLKSLHGNLRNGEICIFAELKLTWISATAGPALSIIQARKAGRVAAPTLCTREIRPWRQNRRSANCAAVVLSRSAVHTKNTYFFCSSTIYNVGTPVETENS
jgi:hypothetical protein